MSHAHRDDLDLVTPRALHDTAPDAVAAPPASTNAELARAAATARKRENAEDAASDASDSEHKFIGDGDVGASRPATDASIDDDVDPILGRAWATNGPPPPRFEALDDGMMWLGGHRFEAVGFADPLPAGSWVAAPKPPASAPLSVRAGWGRR